MTFSERRYDDGPSHDRDRDRDLNRAPASSVPSGQPSTPPMGRIIEMAFSGLWTIKRQGVLAEVGGRLYWPDRQSLERAAAQAGIPLSDVVVHTGRLSVSSR